MNRRYPMHARGVAAAHSAWRFFPWYVGGALGSSF